MSTTDDDVLANTLLAMKAIRDARKIIMVAPALEDEARAAVAESPWPGLLSVVVDPACPPDRIFIIATHAWEAYIDDDRMRHSGHGAGTDPGGSSGEDRPGSGADPAGS